MLKLIEVPALADRKRNFSAGSQPDDGNQCAPIRSGYLWIEDNLRKRDRLYQLANDTRKILQRDPLQFIINAL